MWVTSLTNRSSYYNWNIICLNPNTHFTLKATSKMSKNINRDKQNSHICFFRNLKDFLFCIFTSLYSFVKYLDRFLVDLTLIRLLILYIFIISLEDRFQIDLPSSQVIWLEKCGYRCHECKQLMVARWQQTTSLHSNQSAFVRLLLF